MVSTRRDGAHGCSVIRRSQRRDGIGAEASAPRLLAGVQSQWLLDGRQDSAQRATLAGHVSARRRPEHEQSVGIDEVAPANEHATGMVERLASFDRIHRRDDLVVQLLQITGVARIQDDDVHRHAAAPPVAVRGQQLTQRRQAGLRVDRREHDRPITRDAVGPEMQPRAAIAPQIVGRGARSAGYEKKRWPASSWKTAASAGVRLSSRSSTCVAVQARSSARWAACGSWYRPASSNACSPVVATSVVKATVADWPGRRRTRARRANIGSSTAPVVPLRAPSASSASGVPGRSPASEEPGTIGLAAHRPHALLVRRARRAPARAAARGPIAAVSSR